MNGIKTQGDAVPSKDWMKKTEEMNRDKGDDSSSRNCKESMDWAKTKVEKDASSIDNQYSADMAKIDLQAHPSYEGSQKSMGLLRIEVEKGPSTMDDQQSTNLMKIQVGWEPAALNNQHSTDLKKVEVETKLSTVCDQHSIDLTQIEDEVEPPTVDDQHATDSMKMEVEEEHCTADGQQKAAGERKSSPRVNHGPIRWVKIELQPIAGDNRNFAKLVKMEDADELSSEFTQDSTDLVKLEAGQDICSEVCQDSSCLMKFEEEENLLARDSLGDMDHVKTEECEGPFHSKSPGLIKWVMFETEEDPFYRDSQDCEGGGRNENSATAVQCPKPRPLDVQNETSPERPVLEGRLTRKALREVMAQLSAMEKDTPGAAVEPVSLRHPSLVFSGEVHCNGVAKMIMLKPGSALLRRNVVKRKDLDLLPEHQTAAVEDQYEDVTASPDSHEDDPCSSDTESSDKTEISVSPSTVPGPRGRGRVARDARLRRRRKEAENNLPMIASVFSLRGTEEEKLQSVEHQESAPREDISCNSELPLITSVFTLRGTEEEALHPTKHQESVLPRDSSCNAGVPAVSLLIIGNVLQPLTTPVNTQKGERIDKLGAGDPSMPVMKTGSELQPVVPDPNNPEGKRVSELDPGGANPPVRIVLNKLKDLSSPASAQKQKSIAKPDREFPVITSVFTLRDTEEKDLLSVDNPESERSEDVNFDSGTPMITAVFTLRDEEEEELQPADHRLANRREKVANRKERMAQDPGNFKPEGSRKMKYSAHYQKGPGPYTCTVCGKIFDQFTPFRKHEATHKNLRLHKCSVCGDTFDQNFRLLKHKKTHAVKQRKYMPFILPKPTF